MKLIFEYNYVFHTSVTLNPGRYQFELKGGGGGNKRKHFEKYKIATGGTTVATITFRKKTSLYVYVGGFANYFNGGGYGYIETESNQPKYQLFGGGATDVRTVSGDWNSPESLLSRILVAGGGGAGKATDIAGTPGGGEITEDYIMTGSTGAKYTTTGATQTIPGQGNSSGSFGKGASGATDAVNRQPFHAGGGGWYGGGGGDTLYAGTGGSGYILTRSSYKPTGYTPTPEYYFESGTTTCGTVLEVDNSWDSSTENGYCKIYLLDTIAPTISTNLNDLGSKKSDDELKYSFKLTTMTEDEVTVVEKLNNEIINTRTLRTGDYETVVDRTKILPLEVNSTNNITVVATDSTGKETTQTFTFIKANTKPTLSIRSYNSNSATFTAIDIDNNLSKIEYFIDDVLKETITTDLYLEKTINYELTDNAIHTLKIVATDAENATVEKVLSISKEIMPLGDDADLEDISNKVNEMKEGLINGKTSIANVLSLKNIEAGLNNTLVELSEKVKASFDSGDASIEELQNRITELTNQLSQRKKWDSGIIHVIQDNGKASYKFDFLDFKANIIFAGTKSQYDECPVVVGNNFYLKTGGLARWILNDGIYELKLSNLNPNVNYVFEWYAFE
ncbi:hypothetical protein QCG29_002457 [Clostridioides difficile]|nr:hypothetical protein [Clostridioides difficile]MDM9945606.1 glycine rich domain-containing protein [Clostridioides difficile]